MSWKIYDKTGIERCEVHKLEYSGEFMADRFITVSIKSPFPIPFAIGDFLTYRGEIFTLDYDLSVIKKAETNKAGDAFTYDNIRLNSFISELDNCDFLDYVLNDNSIHFSSLPTFSFNAITIEDLGNRIQANLNRVYTGNKSWTVIIHKENVSVTNVNISVDKINIKSALAFIPNLFKSNYTIKGRTITIGTSGTVIDSVFEYGKGNGLNKISRIVDPSQKITTRLRVYGSDRNLPYRYYNKLTDTSSNAYLPNYMAVQNLMLPSFPYSTLDPYLESENIIKYGVIEESVFFDGSDESLPEIYPSLEGMTAQQLIDAGIAVSIDAGDNGYLDEVVSGATNTDNSLITDDGIFGENVEVPPFRLVLKDIGFDLNNYLSQEKATISMKTGLCGGREFEILSCVKEGNKYILTCNRVEDVGRFFPYSSLNIRSADKFVLLNIQMPEVYIKAASQRLLTAGNEYLSEKDHVNYAYELKISPVYMARNPLLHDTIVEGDYILFNDTDLNISRGVKIDNLRIKEGDEITPTYEILLSDEKQSSILDKLQNRINYLLKKWREKEPQEQIPDFGKNTTYFSKPSKYKKGDTWFLLEDTVVGGILYKKGTLLQAVYETGTEYDWRKVIVDDETNTTDGINLIRNYDLRYGFSLWGDLGTSGELTQVEFDALPKEFYVKKTNVLGDEYGYEYALGSEQDEIIILDE